MSDSRGDPHVFADAARERLAQPIDAETAAALRDSPRGALVLAGFSTGLLLIGWLLFYFLLFIPRGSVG